jgi:hypothetical protein
VVITYGNTTISNFTLAAAILNVDGFETYTDFSLNFAPWVCVDVDMSGTPSFTDVNFPNMGQAMAYIVFNPSTTTPPITDAIWQPHGGSKFAACLYATTPPNNDWLISQAFTTGPGASFSFYAKALSASYPENFNVGMSLDDTNPAQFTIISGDTPIIPPATWTLYTYSIPDDYVGLPIRFGIQCVSNDAFVFMVDDFVVNMGTVPNTDPVTPVVMTSLNGNYPNPFNPETTISYSVKGTSPVTVEIYNVKGQKVKTLVNETKASGNHTIKWNGTDSNNHKVTSGVYFYRMQAGKYTASRKMILMQ